MTVDDIYQQSIKSLTTADRLPLARMILDDIPAQSFVDHNDAWSNEDLRDFTQANWQQSEQEVGESEDVESG